VSELQTVLEFYANPDNYAFNTDGGEIGPNVILDGGSKARMILEDQAGVSELERAAIAWRMADAAWLEEPRWDAVIADRLKTSEAALRVVADRAIAAEAVAQ
jgi:hypothetical protein